MNRPVKEKPQARSSLGEKELDKVEKQLDAFESQVKELTLDRMNEMAPAQPAQKAQISSAELEKSEGIYLKPHRSIGAAERFNENYRKEYEFAKEYVHFSAKNNEIIGEDIDMWTKPFAGMPCEWWKVPVNKPVWAPRYVAEQIRRKKYHRLVMQENIVESSSIGKVYGTLVADTSIQRLDAEPVSSHKSVFMNSSNF